MPLLLDTHVFLWAVSDSPRLTPPMRALLNEAPTRHLSSVSAYEISVKAARGRLPGGQAVLAGWAGFARRLQLGELSLTSEHMIRAGALDWEHRDPFDRMLVAQAQVEGMVLVTSDATIRSFSDVRTTWK